MVTHRELFTYVRFQLEQLSVRNAQHEFEHLCRQLARLRVCSNILPATGPVTARGDQGRDAESFRAYLANSPLAASTFLGLVSDRPITFAVTLQRRENNLKGKIERDVKEIRSKGSPVDEIHYFCADDLDSGTRHLLQEWASRDCGVVLEIYDGQAIAELLCWRDSFWIATEYLNVPGEMYPEPPSGDSDEWYRPHLTQWRFRPNPPLTYANFAEIKSALRHCTFSEDYRNDLPFWMERIEAYTSEDAPTILQYRAIYELCVAALRGLGTMEGYDSRLVDYFPTMLGSDRVADLEDAAVLVTYCFGARRAHATHLSLKTLTQWRDELVEVLDHQLAGNPTIGRKCHLLGTLGFIVCLSIGYGVPVEGRSAVQIWLELAELADRAPLFPIERLSEQLAIVVPVAGDDPGFTELTKRLDVLVAERAGQAAAAGKCRDRAMAFYKQGKILRAMAELHQAKVKWFAEETLLGAVLAMLFIARCYQELGLHYAAKYYAMAAAWVSIHSERQALKDKTWQALIFASECDYMVGNWRGYLLLSDLGMKSHWWLARHAGDYDEHPALDRVFYHATICQAMAEQIDGDLASAVWEAITGWGLTTEIEALMPSARKMMAGKDADAVLALASDQLSGRPFSDLASERVAVWEALGITWRIHWRNEPATNAAAEEFVATLQVAFSDFAKHDLLLIRTEAEIEVSLGETLSPEVKEQSSNEGRIWGVILPAAGRNRRLDKSHYDAELVGVAVYVLREASYLPQEQFMKAFEDVMRDGLTAKVLVARPFPELLREFYGDHSPLDEIEVPERLRTAERWPVPPAHEELRWRDGPAPGYDETSSHEAIARRYEVTPKKIPITLARLAQSPEFQHTLASLRSEGWKDWHVLLAVANTVFNVRMWNTYGLHGPDSENAAEMQHSIIDVADDLEAESLAPVDLDLFSVEKLHQMMDFGMAAVLKVWGLECHQLAPDIPAMRDFLARRYKFWTDDIPHEDPFTLPQQSGIILVSRD